MTPEDVFQRLAEKENWFQVYNDPILRPRILSQFTKLREVYDDIRTKKEIEETADKRLFRRARKPAGI